MQFGWLKGDIAVAERPRGEIRVVLNPEGHFEGSL